MRQAWPLAVTLALALGCDLQQGDTPTGQQVRHERLEGGRLPYREARLILAGTEMEVDMKADQVGEEFAIHILAHGEEFEVERYRLSERGFAFAGVSGEGFDPPIPLATFPLTVGEGWAWQGHATLGPKRNEAKAKVTTAAERLNLATGVYDTVLVNVDLDIDTGGHQASRQLQFWIEPKVGVVRRAFGSGSTREPRPATERE